VTPRSGPSSPDKLLWPDATRPTFDECVGGLPEKLKTPFALRELDGEPSMGRVDVVMNEDSSAVVSWLTTDG
jgi:hypothetical protein